MFVVIGDSNVGESTIIKILVRDISAAGRHSSAFVIMAMNASDGKRRVIFLGQPRIASGDFQLEAPLEFARECKPEAECNPHF
jgi:hypothetical protein